MALEVVVEEVKYFMDVVVVVIQVVLVLGFGVIGIIGLDSFVDVVEDGVALTLLNTYNVN
jgi:hypothetical protein